MHSHWTLEGRHTAKTKTKKISTKKNDATKYQVRLKNNKSFKKKHNQMNSLTNKYIFLKNTLTVRRAGRQVDAALKGSICSGCADC